MLNLRASFWWALLVALVVVAAVVFFVPRPKAQTVSADFEFTWPGDDYMVGTCAGVELRWSTAAVVGADTLGWWGGATRFAGPYPAPVAAGNPGAVTVPGLPNGTIVYAVMRAFDEKPNWSAFSNIAVAVTEDLIPPSPPTGLRAKVAP